MYIRMQMYVRMQMYIGIQMYIRTMNLHVGLLQECYYKESYTYGALSKQHKLYTGT